MDVALDLERWDWGRVTPESVDALGRRCVRLAGVGDVVTLRGIELRDGVVEAELAIPSERSFHGVVWRAGDCGYESFFLRPHQVGNPDAVQYTPVFHGVSAWQLYHGDGCWKEVAFPVGDWLRLRVAFSEDAAEVSIDDELVLVSRLRLPAVPGGIGLLVGGDALLVDTFSFATAAPTLSTPPALPAEPGAIVRWEVSDPFPEEWLGVSDLDAALVAGRTWRPLDAEPPGLVDLARASGVAAGRNTVLARVTLSSDRAQRVALELGFSDRALVYLNDVPLFRGADEYRSRDYRFLGSIGWFDTVFLALREGDNELVVAVSEEFGGWGVQARLRDAPGVVVSSA